jgi:uncharacterized protein YacL
MNTETSFKQKTLDNTKRLARWTAAWLVTMALANFGPTFIWSHNELLSSLAIALNVLVGGGMIWANKIHLNGLDELQQKIQLQAMALALGVGLVIGLAYSNLDVTNLINSDAEISHLVILMGLTYIVGTVLGVRKYQ